MRGTSATQEESISMSPSVYLLLCFYPGGQLIRMYHYHQHQLHQQQQIILFIRISLQDEDVLTHVGRDGALVESIIFNQRVVGSTPTLAIAGALGKSFTCSCLCASA